MLTSEFNPYDEGPSPEQQAAEAAALAQGEQLAAAEEADRRARLDELSRDAEDVQLIAGKFKSQEDLLKAYKELEAKLGGKGQEEEEEGVEEPEEASEEVPEQAPDSAFAKATQEYNERGELSEEAIEQLSQMDPKELIRSYLEYYRSSNQQAEINAREVANIQASVGGPEAYAEITSWAAENLSAQEIADFNTITNSGNLPAARFAVEALAARYRGSVGYEPKLVSGKKGGGGSGVKPYRSQAELARDIANPNYDKDPAFRADVMSRLAVSKDLL